jgi:hypothetical protein
MNAFKDLIEKFDKGPFGKYRRKGKILLKGISIKWDIFVLYWRTTPLDTTRPSTIFYRLLLN